MYVEKVFLDKEVEREEIPRRVLERLKDVPVEVIHDREKFHDQMRSVSVTNGKKILWLTRFNGTFVKPCPATGEDYLCCRYWVINNQTNCPLDCTYCILQNYLNQPLLTIYSNIQAALTELEALTSGDSSRMFRIGTGELTDSFALDSLTEWNQDLIEFALSRRFILELKTKVAHISYLRPIRKKNIVISWSLNPQEIIETEEFKTASLNERLQAALLAISKGYRIGFHFDPIVEIPDWQLRYQELINRLTEMIPEEEIVWISFGSLRFPPDLKKVIDARFPRSLIGTGEIVQGLDGKMRYFRPVRLEMYRKIYSWIRKRWKNVFIYFCMEHENIWKEIMGSAPENNAHLDFLFHESLFKRFPDLDLPYPDRNAYA